MSRITMSKIAIIMFLACCALLPVQADSALQIGKIKTDGGWASLKGNTLMLRINDPMKDPAVRMLPPEGQKYWDMSKAVSFAAEATNLSLTKQGRFLIILRTPENIKPWENRGRFIAGISLNPGETRTLRFALPHRWLYSGPEKTPALRSIDTAQITYIDFALHGDFEKAAPGLTNCKLENIRLEGTLDPAKLTPRSKIAYFPFVDKYGQFIHADWPEKIHSDADLKAARAKEQVALDASKRPEEWDQYGGWMNGPQLKATGNFRTEKYQGKWYLVDPSGKLFFSHGLDVVFKYTDKTDTTGHKHWFAADSDAQKIKIWLPYERTLQVKYGKADYTAEFYQNLIKRLQHWGYNTIGDWAAADFITLGKVPYTLQLTDYDKTLPALGPKFYDVYHPDFEKKMKNIFNIADEKYPVVKKSLTDPMCIGYWIDNELHFGYRHGFKFREWVMKANAQAPVKKAFVASVKRRYDSIEKVNKAWQSSFKDWNALAGASTVLKSKGFQDDMMNFYKETVERYFQLCRDAVKSVAPHRLYLGCRFVCQDATIPVLAEACGKYVDVFSVNVYRHTPGNFRIEEMPDKPVIIGEFHFSTSLPGRGMFSPDIVAGMNEAERAMTYRRYLQGALVHPNIVGAHWFMLRDQPLTGRFDGEGYQIGLVDVADTPYREMTEVTREVGENMYRYRQNGKYNNAMK